MLLEVTTSDHRLNSLLQVILSPFTGGAPSKNTLFMCTLYMQCILRYVPTHPLPVSCCVWYLALLTCTECLASDWASAAVPHSWRAALHRRRALGRSPCTDQTLLWTSKAERGCQASKTFAPSHRCKLLDLLVRGSKRGQTNLLGELGKVGIREDGCMANQLVENISDIHKYEM